MIRNAYRPQARVVHVSIASKPEVSDADYERLWSAFAEGETQAFRDADASREARMKPSVKAEGKIAGKTS